MNTRYSCYYKNWSVFFLSYLVLTNSQAIAFDLQKLDSNKFPEFDTLENQNLIESIFNSSRDNELKTADFRPNSPTQNKLIEEVYAQLNIANDDRCLTNYSLENQRVKFNAGVFILPQTELENIFKGIYDYSQNSACFTEEEKTIAADTDVQPVGNGQKIYEFALSLKDEAIAIESLPIDRVESVKINPGNSLYQGLSRLEQNRPFLNLITNLAINVPKPQVYSITRQTVTAATPVGYSFNEQQYLNYVNATTTTYGKLTNVSSNPNNIQVNNPTIPSSPLQQKLKKDLEKRQKRLRKKQKEQQKQIQKRIQQQRKQEERKKEQRLKQLKKQQQEQQRRFQQRLKEQQKRLKEQQRRR